MWLLGLEPAQSTADRYVIEYTYHIPIWALSVREYMDLPHANNGMMTKIWGGPGWVFCHSVSFGYPLRPTEEQKRHYLEFFRGIGHVLPCCYCRESYQTFIQEEPTILDWSVMENRGTLTYWLYQIHERVNHKLGIRYLFTYQDLQTKYESFRAKCVQNTGETGCTAPLDWKTFSFQQAESKDAPVISIELARQFLPLANAHGIPKHHQYVLQWDDLAVCKNSQDLWRRRNKLATGIIRHMREQGIPSLEPFGPLQGYPTIMETRLIMMASSNLPEAELETLV